jgi:uncharacterized damage-inducible protein DinB
MNRGILAVLVAVAGPGLAAAQEMQSHGHAGGITAIQPLYARVKDLYIRSAEAMPEEHYAYRPVATVRTFGEVLGHVANENYLFCANALGEKNPKDGTDYEKTTAKADMVKAVRESFAYCDPAYQMAEAKAMEETTFFGNKGSRLWVLIFNVTHDSEHYGNIVTYMREKGLVPPSSRGN